MWLLLDPSAGWVVAGTELGWRLAIFIGAVLAAAMIVMRRWIPESPRWLLTRNREREAARVVEDMEKACGRVPHVELEKISVGRFSPRLREIWHRDKMRVVVAVFLMAASAFFYNGVFSIFHKVLHDLYGLAPDQIGWYLMIFAGGNLAGPLMLGWCFDKYGRRLMISLTYVLSGILLVGSGFVIEYGDRTVVEPTIIAWTVTFFFASAAASSAHLTAGETFPLTVRVRMIALCVAIAAFVGMVGPPIFDGLVDTKQHAGVFEGYFLATLFMVAAGCIEWFYGVDAERKTLVWRLRLPVRSRCAQTRPRV